VRALLLSFYAAQNRSLFAAKCLVETVIEMYREGLTLDDVKLMVALAGGAMPGGTHCYAPPLLHQPTRTPAHAPKGKHTDEWYCSYEHMGAASREEQWP
jgi:hypothetical protein